MKNTDQAIVKLGAIASVFSGFAFKSSDLGSNGIPVIKIGNIQSGGVQSHCVDHFPSELLTSKLDRYILQQGDSLVAMTGAGSVGKFGRMLKVSQRFLVNQRVGIIRPNQAKCDPAFVFYALSLPNYEKTLYAQGLGAGQPNVSAKQISDLEVPAPDLPTQRRIASILSAYDDLIENNTRRIAILEKMARRIYEEWFVHFRFPGHEQVKMVESELGLIPEGWRASRIGSEFKTILGGTPSRSKPEYWENGTIPWINSGKVNELRILEPSELITPLGLNKSATKLMPVGTTVLAITGATLGQVSILSTEMCANQSVVGILDTSGRYSEFVYRAVQHQIWEIIQKASGGAQQHINKEIVNDVLIVLPDDATLKAFDDKATPIGRFISNLLKKNTALRATRDLLLPKLISGELDVSTLPDPEEEAI